MKRVNGGIVNGVCIFCDTDLKTAHKGKIKCSEGKSSDVIKPFPSSDLLFGHRDGILCSNHYQHIYHQVDTGFPHRPKDRQVKKRKKGVRLAGVKVWLVSSSNKDSEVLKLFLEFVNSGRDRCAKLSQTIINVMGEKYYEILGVSDDDIQKYTGIESTTPSIRSIVVAKEESKSASSVKKREVDDLSADYDSELEGDDTLSVKSVDDTHVNAAVSDKQVESQVKVLGYLKLIHEALPKRTPDVDPSRFLIREHERMRLLPEAINAFLEQPGNEKYQIFQMTCTHVQTNVQALRIREASVADGAVVAFKGSSFVIDARVSSDTTFPVTRLECRDILMMGLSLLVELSSSRGGLLEIKEKFKGWELDGPEEGWRRIVFADRDWQADAAVETGSKRERVADMELSSEEIRKIQVGKPLLLLCEFLSVSLSCAAFESSSSSMTLYSCAVCSQGRDGCRSIYKAVLAPSPLQRW
jgi:hypothetical protein